MYKTLITLSLAGLTLYACKPTPRTVTDPHSRKQEQTSPESTVDKTPSSGPSEKTPDQPPPPAQEADPSACLLDVDITTQDYNLLRPWEKQQPSNIAISGVYLGDGRVLTYGGPLEVATYIEMSLPDRSQTVPARVLRYDSDLQLGLLTVRHQEDAHLFDTRQSHGISAPLQKGDSAELWCTLRGTDPLRIPLHVESGEVDDGMPRLSLRADQAIPGDSSFGAPIMKDGRLAGISAGYNAAERKVLVINAEILRRFLDASDQTPRGVPIMGIEGIELTDPVFRKYLKLNPSQTGIYISSVKPNSAAKEAGVQKGDVLTAIEGMAIDSQGRCELPIYGRTPSPVVTRYLKPIGETLQISLSRDGEEINLPMPLNRDAEEKALMRTEKPGTPPRYIVWGGLVFQPLTETYLQTLQQQAKNSLPVEFLELENRKEELQEKGYRELVALTLVIPTPATLGYDTLGFCVLEKINGKEVHSLEECANLLDEPTPDGIVELTLNKAPYTIYLDRATAESSNDTLRRYSIPHLRRLLTEEAHSN